MAFLKLDDLVEVKRFLFNVKEKWYNIGLNLKVKLADLNQIRDQHINDKDYDACLREMLQKWLKQFPNKPTWGRLADALREKDVDEGELADEGMAIHSLEGSFPPKFFCDNEFKEIINISLRFFTMW